MRSGSADARLSRIWGISLLPYSVEVFIAIATILEEDIGKATGNSIYCKGQVREIGVVNDNLDAIPTYITILKIQAHTCVQEYNIVRRCEC